MERGGDGRHHRGEEWSPRLQLSLSLLLSLSSVPRCMRRADPSTDIRAGGVVSKVGGAVAVMEMKVDLPLFSKPVVGLCHSGGSTGHHGKVGASSLRDRYMRSFSRAVIGYPQPRDNSVRLR